jgi:hypothetical protein
VAQLPAWLRDARELDGRFAFLRERGRWFWGLVAIGVVARAHLVLATQGTYDVEIWDAHARAVLSEGIAGAYRAVPLLNHPPLATFWVSRVLVLAESTGLPFPALLRAPIAALDLGCIGLLAILLRESRYRFLIAGLYAVQPVAIVLSSYHGNSDSSIGFFLLLATIFAVRGEAIRTGAAVGVSLWIKLPGLLALPALVASFPRWRDRFACGTAAVLTAAVPYVPMLVIDPGLLYQNVFGYRGQMLHTTTGTPIWGPLGLLIPVLDAAGSARPLVSAFARGWYEYDSIVLLVPILALAWLRRDERGAFGLGKTIAACYAVTYGFSMRWAFQYLAWSVPFWGLAGRFWFAGATLLAGAYLYGLYAWLCGDWLLRGEWDFIGHPHWPLALLLVRDAAVVFFMAVTCIELFRAGRKALRRAR